MGVVLLVSTREITNDGWVTRMGMNTTKNGDGRRLVFDITQTRCKIHVEMRLVHVIELVDVHFQYL